MKVNIARIASLATLIVAAVPGLAQNCSNSGYQGVYSATVLGSFISPPLGIPPGPTARVGLVTVDGKGSASIVTTLSLDGLIIQENYGGTYSIASDCTASVILEVPFPGSPAPVPFQFSGVLANNGEMMNLILLNPAGTDVRINLTKQRKLVCMSNDLDGDYSLTMSGTIISGFNLPPGLFARAGKLTFDGSGNFTASVQTSYAGSIYPETFAGTYTMNTNCSFTTTFTLGSTSSGWFGVMEDTVSGANVIQSSPSGAVVTGVLTSVR